MKEKVVTLVIDKGEMSVMDLPEGLKIHVVNLDDTRAMVTLTNGMSATVTELLPDTEVLNSLSPNARTVDGIPHRPDLVYADEWQGWANFFGWVPIDESEAKEFEQGEGAR